MLLLTVWKHKEAQARARSTHAGQSRAGSGSRRVLPASVDVTLPPRRAGRPGPPNDDPNAQRTRPSRLATRDHVSVGAVCAGWPCARADACCAQTPRARTAPPRDGPRDARRSRRRCPSRLVRVSRGVMARNAVARRRGTGAAPGLHALPDARCHGTPAPVPAARSAKDSPPSRLIPKPPWTRPWRRRRAAAGGDDEAAGAAPKVEVSTRHAAEAEARVGGPCGRGRGGGAARAAGRAAAGARGGGGGRGARRRRSARRRRRRRRLAARRWRRRRRRAQRRRARPVPQHGSGPRTAHDGSRPESGLEGCTIVSRGLRDGAQRVPRAQSARIPYQVHRLPGSGRAASRANF